MAFIANVVPGYTDVDLYGRGSDRIFGEGAQAQTSREAKVHQKHGYETLSKQPVTEYVDYDLYGRGDPRIFGKNAHLENKAEAAKYAKKVGTSKALGIKLKSMAFPSGTPALFKCFKGDRLESELLTSKDPEIEVESGIAKEQIREIKAENTLRTLQSNIKETEPAYFESGSSDNSIAVELGELKTPSLRTVHKLQSYKNEVKASIEPGNEIHENSSVKTGFQVTGRNVESLATGPEAAEKSNDKTSFKPIRQEINTGNQVDKKAIMAGSAIAGSAIVVGASIVKISNSDSDTDSGLHVSSTDSSEKMASDSSDLIVSESIQDSSEASQSSVEHDQELNAPALLVGEQLEGSGLPVAPTNIASDKSSIGALEAYGRDTGTSEASQGLLEDADGTNLAFSSDLPTWRSDLPAELVDVDVYADDESDEDRDVSENSATEESDGAALIPRTVSAGLEPLQAIQTPPEILRAHKPDDETNFESVASPTTPDADIFNRSTSDRKQSVASPTPSDAGMSVDRAASGKPSGWVAIAVNQIFGTDQTVNQATDVPIVSTSSSEAVVSSSEADLSSESSESNDRMAFESSNDPIGSDEGSGEVDQRIFDSHSDEPIERSESAKSSGEQVREGGQITAMGTNGLMESSAESAADQTLNEATDAPIVSTSSSEVAVSSSEGALSTESGESSDIMVSESSEDAMDSDEQTVEGDQVLSSGSDEMVARPESANSFVGQTTEGGQSMTNSANELSESSDESVELSDVILGSSDEQLEDSDDMIDSSGEEFSDAAESFDRLNVLRSASGSFNN